MFHNVPQAAMILFSKQIIGNLYNTTAYTISKEKKKVNILKKVLEFHMVHRKIISRHYAILLI